VRCVPSLSSDVTWSDSPIRVGSPICHLQRWQCGKSCSLSQSRLDVLW
jgi:hypothetical protein